MTCTLVIDRTERDAAARTAPPSPWRDPGVMNVSCTIPTGLPEALRDASYRAAEHAADPFNRLDYNPYIGDEWAIVAAEFQALADKLERRFHALFDGKDTPCTVPHPRSGTPYRIPQATERNSAPPAACTIHQFAA